MCVCVLDGGKQKRNFSRRSSFKALQRHGQTFTSTPAARRLSRDGAESLDKQCFRTLSSVLSF